MPKCIGIKDNGESCGSWPLRGEKWCSAHHPDKQKRAEFLARSAKGGKATGYKRVEIPDYVGRTTAEQMLAVIDAEIETVRNGRVDENSSRTVAMLSREKRQILEIMGVFDNPPVVKIIIEESEEWPPIANKQRIQAMDSEEASGANGHSPSAEEAELAVGGEAVEEDDIWDDGGG